MTTRCEPFGAGKIASEDFGEWYNPSPGWPYMHHNQMGYAVEAVAADGYTFSHWQVVGRASNNPNDVYNKVVDVRSLISIDLNFQKANSIKSPLVYLVAHFKPVELVEEPVLESPPTTFEPETSENDGCCIPTIEELPDTEWISIDEITKDEILRALDDITANVEKIRNMVEEI